MNEGVPEYPRRSMQQQVLKDKELQMVFWQSDQHIVSVRQSNVCGEKVLARMRQEVRDTSSTLRGGAKMSTKLTSLTRRARENPKCKFTSLMHLLTEELLLECFGELKRDKSPGIDGVTVEEYEVNLEENLKDLVRRMKRWEYRPKSSKRVYIPKA